MMKKVIFAVMAMAILVSTTMMASVEISKREKVSPVDEIWMDMAVTVAKVNVEEGGIPCGAVVVLNGRLQSSGQATEKATSISVYFYSSVKSEPDVRTHESLNLYVEDGVLEFSNAGSSLSTNRNGVNYGSCLTIDNIKLVYDK